MRKQKYLLAFAGTVLMYSNYYSQINLRGPAQQLANELRGVFPYVAVAIFVVVILSNLGKFVNDNGDWKKGVTNIVIFAAVLGAIQGLVAYVANMTV